MQTHPLWRPFGLVDLDHAASVRVGGRPPRTIEVVPYDASWPALYERVTARVVAALGDRVLALAHVGSTAVPGLAAKPVIDIDLTLADPDDEGAYVPQLERAGLRLRVREPDWQQHRVLTCEEPRTNLHVFPPSAQELGRHLAFRNWLRRHPEDRLAYDRLKTELATRGFTDSTHYNNHKADLVYDIYERIFTADPEHDHTPQPRPRPMAQKA